MTTPGQDSRGDAALRQAIATGSPVPTTGEQAKELNTPAPSQRWGVYDKTAEQWIVLSGQLLNGQPLTRADAEAMCSTSANYQVRPYPAPTPPDNMPKIAASARMTAFHASDEQAKELVRIELPKPDYTGLQQWFKQLAKAAGGK